MLGRSATDGDAGRPIELPAYARRFKVGRGIGEGGMGRAREAEDLQFRRVVALKQRRGGPGDPEANRRFGVEDVITANLEHPGIPAVYERGRSDDGLPYYAMRLVRGRSFADVIREAADCGPRPSTGRA